MIIVSALSQRKRVERERESLTTYLKYCNIKFLLLEVFFILPIPKKVTFCILKYQKDIGLALEDFKCLFQLMLQSQSNKRWSNHKHKQTLLLSLHYLHLALA